MHAQRHVNNYRFQSRACEYSQPGARLCTGLRPFRDDAAVSHAVVDRQFRDLPDRVERPEYLGAAVWGLVSATEQAPAAERMVWEQALHALRFGKGFHRTESDG